MVVQINFQDYGNKPRRVGAAFAIDEAGSPVVVHRGHIGGGRVGVSRSLMLDECRCERVILQEEDGKRSDCFVIGQLQSKLFVQQLANFVREVYRVKNLDKTLDDGLTGVANSLLSLDDSSLSKEKTGVFNRTRSGEVNFTHGLVVNELANQLTVLSKKQGWQLRNDRHRDLMLLHGGKLKVLFEIKTGLTSQSLCTALGQLLVYSASQSKVSLVMVLPEVLSKDIELLLSRWNVRPLYYEWRDTKLHFKQLKKIMETV